MGKTALALYWAHQVTDSFPDGQLYVNLRGYEPEQPAPAADVLAGFLRALGVLSMDIPAGVDERAAKYRSLLAGRRMLVVLDNAGSTEQWRSLLPGSSRQLGIRHAILASQIRQLETVTGTALLRTGPNEMIVLTPDGEQFARDVRPVLEALTQSREKNPSHAP